jgi:predicted alpha-1,6-mannanase (GH76 family)
MAVVNSEWLVNDGLDVNGSCLNNGQTTWTYNQGVVLGGLVELHKATGASEYLQTALNIADAVLSSPLLTPAGILTEPCDPAACDDNQSAFKGAFIRNLAKLNVELPSRPYSAFISNNVQTMYAHDMAGRGFYGLSWKGPYRRASIGSQVSAVMLLVAARRT